VTARGGPLPRQAWIFLPLGLGLLLAVAAFTLASYRNALEQLVEQRQAEALRIAGSVADRGVEGSPAGGLGQVAPTARRLAVANGRGEVRWLLGEPLPGAFFAPLEVPPADRVAVGPLPGLPETAAWVRLAEDRFLRLDLPAGELAAQLRAVRVLTWVDLAVMAAASLWLLLFLQRILRPWDELMARARAHAPEIENEEAFLVQTLETALARRAAAGELEALEEALAPRVDSGLLLLDRDGQVLALNPAGSRLLGIEPPLPRTPLADALGAEAPLVGMVAEALAAGERSDRRSAVIAATGSRTLSVTMTPLRRTAGDLLGLLVLFADVTEAHRADEEGRLAESLAQLGELAAGVAHELRNGLATIGGYCSLLERRVGGGEAAEDLDELRRETSHLQRVVADFLAFARPGTARPEAVDLLVLARRAAADPALPAGRVRAPAGADGDTAPLVTGDPELLERAVRNLLHNAVEASATAAATAPVEVAVRTVGEHGELTICDRGDGLPEAVRRRLFQPFTSARPDGTGLGLALAHRIVTLHGGSLRLEDRSGGGTCAVVVLPRRPAPDQSR
jgi:signal transduction histidine kinase